MYSVLKDKKRWYALLFLLLACSILLALVTVITKSGHEFEHAPSVQIDFGPAGTVSGRVIEAQGGERINVYRNIPYAVPPLKELRWKPSTLLKNGWSGEFDGTHTNQIQCVNISGVVDTVRGVEDCLVLTVRAPASTHSPRPVIVWIHGGGLFNGYGENPGYTTDEDFTEAMDAVTVSVNYRLGITGFMSVDEFTEEGNYGNYGFSDMITALRWVKAHIAGFGGDPEAVTILGESGGGTAVLGLVSSPKANNLFHNAISLSPAPVWNTRYTDANRMFNTWVSNANCTQPTKAKRLACMQNLDIIAVSNAAMPLFGFGYSGFYFDFPLTFGAAHEQLGFAVVEPVIVPQPPHNLVNAKFKPKSKVKLIISSTAEETGLVSRLYGRNNFPNTTQGWYLVNETLVNRTRAIKGVTAAEVINGMWSAYPAFPTPQAAWDIITTDLRGTCPINDLAQAMALSEHHEVYRMFITNHIPDWPSYHGYDTTAMFGFKYALFNDLSASQKAHMATFKQEIQRVIKDFVYEKDESEWEAFPGNTKVLTDTAPWSRMVSQRVQQSQCEFWRDNDMVKYGWQN